MLRFGKFLRRLELNLITYRDAHQASSARRNKFDEEFVKRSAVIVINPEDAKIYGFKDGDIVKVSADDRHLNLKLRVDEIAPKNYALMPRSIYSSYLGSKTVTIEPTDGEITDVEKILKLLK